MNDKLVLSSAYPPASVNEPRPDSLPPVPVPSVSAAPTGEARSEEPRAPFSIPGTELAALIPVGVYACDAAGRITFFNPRIIELWGQQPNLEATRFCGASRAWKLDGERMLPEETPMATALRRGRRIRDHEFIIERPDGIRLACSASIEPHYDAAGVLRGAVAALQDVTERKRSEELLGRQADLLAQTQDAIFAWRWNGTIVFWNRGSERLYGFSAQEALGRKCYQLLRTETPRDFEELRAKLSREGHVSEELVQFTRDGRRRVIESKLVLSRTFDAQPVVLETNRDITERKRIEAALRDSEEHLRLAIDAGQVGTWDWNIVEQRVTWSKHVYQFHGLDPAQFEGSVEASSGRIHPDDRERVEKAIELAIRTQTPYSSEMRILRPTGEVRWLFTNGRAFYDETGKPTRMLGATVDITERRRAVEALEQAVKDRTAKLRETVGELEAFSYSVSHDLRAPLRAMHGYAVALLEDCAGKLNTQELQYLQRISEAAQRLDRLINDVLTYSRLARTDVRFDPVDLDRTMREVMFQYPALHPSKARVEIQAPLGAVLGHEALIVQALSNLMINAVKFVAPGVFPVVRVWSERREESLRVWIADNGIGIAPHNFSRVFGIFQRLNAASEYEGTGIGLSIVRKAIERLGGSVGLESEEGKGSRFWLELKRLESAHPFHGSAHPDSRR